MLRGAILVAALAVVLGLVAGCMDQGPSPGEPVQSQAPAGASRKQKASVGEFDVIPAPPGVKTGTPGG
jgi:hypothetical protein